MCVYIYIYRACALPLPLDPVLSLLLSRFTPIARLTRSVWAKGDKLKGEQVALVQGFLWIYNPV